MNETASNELSPVHTTIIGDENAKHRVVFLHGLLGRGKNFTTIAKGLSPEVVSLLVDVPNHGESSWTEDFDYVEIADLIAQELRAHFAADGPVDVVGHSMGGKVAMVLALQYPELVRRLAVLDISPVTATSGRGEFEHLLGALQEVDLATAERRSDVSTALSARVPETGLRGFLLQNLQQTENGLQWGPNIDLLLGQLDKVMAFPDFSALISVGGAFQKPVMWLGGGKSAYITDEHEPTMRALFPKTERQTIEDAGHWVHSEKPAETLQALRDFLLKN